MKLLKVEGERGHVTQCPIAGNATACLGDPDESTLKNVNWQDKRANQGLWSKAGDDQWKLTIVRRKWNCIDHSLTPFSNSI